MKTNYKFDNNGCLVCSKNPDTTVYDYLANGFTPLLGGC